MHDYKVSVSIIEPEYFKTNMTAIGPMDKGTRDLYEELPPALKEEFGQEYLEKSTPYLNYEIRCFNTRLIPYNMLCFGGWTFLHVVCALSRD